MQTADKTAERMEMAAMKAGNSTLAADDIDWFVSKIECLCEWHILSFYPVILNCPHRIVASPICNEVKKYLLSSVEMLCRHSQLNKDCGKQL
jgi:hypothetical protein